MTDPDALKNEPQDVPPPQPPRPQGRAQMSQLEADELYARQLAEHYNNAGAYEARTANPGHRPSRGAPLDDDREHSFIDDDLPVITENLRKGFQDTQVKVNGWISNLRKKIEENFDESEQGPHMQGQPSRRPGEASRRSGDYDADPQILNDDFAGMRFSADGSKCAPTMDRSSSANSRIAPANRNVYRPPPPSSSPRPGDGRRVGFREETEEINMYDTSPKVPPKDTPPTSAAKASKWQPLSSVDPSPITDNDPFSLGDSEDEKDAKDKPKDAPKGTDDKDNERLKQAAAEAMSDSLVDSTKEDAAAKKP